MSYFNISPSNFTIQIPPASARPSRAASRSCEVRADAPPAAKDDAALPPLPETPFELRWPQAEELYQDWPVVEVPWVPGWSLDRFGE